SSTLCEQIEQKGNKCGGPALTGAGPCSYLAPCRRAQDDADGAPPGGSAMPTRWGSLPGFAAVIAGSAATTSRPTFSSCSATSRSIRWSAACAANGADCRTI